MLNFLLLRCFIVDCRLTDLCDPCALHLDKGWDKWYYCRKCPSAPKESVIDEMILCRATIHSLLSLRKYAVWWWQLCRAPHFNSTWHRCMQLYCIRNYQTIQRDIKHLMSRRVLSFLFFKNFRFHSLWSRHELDLLSFSSSGCHGGDPQEPCAWMPFQHYRLRLNVQIVVHNQPELWGGKALYH